jgi:uncharacterized protein YcbX
MPTPIGEVAALYRYPVKSMAGESVDAAELGWHGLTGDRRLALRRLDDRGGFPWLTASRLPELILHAPVRHGGDPALPTHVRTPDGRELGVFSPDLADEIGRRHGTPVEMVHLDRGIFDEASVSVITAATIEAIAALASGTPDARRFRPNVVIASRHARPFDEDAWVGGTLAFGDAADGPAIAVTNWDVRCAMVSLDPDSARATPEVLKAIVRERDNKAGVYAAVVRRGRLVTGQPVFFEPAGGSAASRG